MCSDVFNLQVLRHGDERRGGDPGVRPDHVPAGATGPEVDAVRLHDLGRRGAGRSRRHRAHQPRPCHGPGSE